MIDFILDVGMLVGLGGLWLALLVGSVYFLAAGFCIAAEDEFWFGAISIVFGLVLCAVLVKVTPWIGHTLSVRLN